MTVALIILALSTIALAGTLATIDRRHRTERKGLVALMRKRLELHAREQSTRHAELAGRLDETLDLLRTDESLVGKSVLVSTTGSTAIQGIVHAEHPDRITLRDAVVMTLGKDAQAPAAGLVHIERIRIDITQELPPRPAPDTEG